MRMNRPFSAAGTGFLVLASALFLTTCDNNPSNWSQVCVDPFERVQPKGPEASFEDLGGEVVIDFPIRVAGTASGSSDGSYGLPEAVDEAYQLPGTEFPLNSLRAPLDALMSGEAVPLGPGSGISLEGFLWNDHLHLEFNWDFPDDWKGTFKEEMCNHSCDLNHEGDADCGIHWDRRYAFSEDQLEGTLSAWAFGTLPGDRVDLELLGIAVGVDMGEHGQDCCSGLHLTLKGAVGEDGRIALEEYCDDPRGNCGTMLELFDMMPFIPLVFHCAGSPETREEELDHCREEANGVAP